MRSNIDRRIIELETRQARRVPMKRVLHLRHDYTPSEYAAELAASRATGWLGPVVIGGPDMSAAEWEATYCREDARA